MGSFPVDIDLRFDQASALRAYKEFTGKAKEMMKEVEAGVEGAGKRLTKLQEDFARQVISTSTRAGRQVESSIRSLERQAEMAGKSYSQQLLVRQERWIKALGDDEKAIKRVTAAFQQLIKTEEEEQRKRQSGGAGSGVLALRGVRDIFEGRSAYGYMDLGRAALGMAGGGAAGAGGGIAATLAAIPTATLALSGMAITLGGVTFASYKAAEAVGEYASQVHRLQIETGMSAEDVQKFNYAAEVTGTDVTSITRMMRPLAQALDESGASAQRSREKLRAMGVDLYGLSTGSLVAKDAIIQVAGALEANGKALLRDKDVIDLFKRAGMESLPMLVELKKSLQEASDIPFMSGEATERFEEVHKHLIRVKTELEQIKLAFQGGLAEVFIGLMDALSVANLPKLKPELTPENLSGLAPRSFNQEQRLGMLGSLVAAGVGSEKFRGFAIGETHEDYIKRLRVTDTEAAREWAGEQKKIYSDYLKETSTKTIEEVTKQKNVYLAAEAHAKALEEADRNRLAIAEELRKASLLGQQRQENPFLLPAQAALDSKLRMTGITPADARQFSRAYAGQIEFEQTQQANKFQRQMLDVQRIADREAARAQYVEPVNIRELGQGGVTRADVERDITAQYQRRMDIAMQTFRGEYEDIKARDIDARDTVALEQQRRDLVATTGKLRTAEAQAGAETERETFALAQRERDLDREHALELAKIPLSDRLDEIRYDAQLKERRAQLRFKDDSPAEGIAESRRIALDAAQQAYDSRVAMIDLEEKGFEKQRDHLLALRDLDKERYRAREEAELKLAEMQQKQLDTLKGKIEPLYQTLFTDPRKFGQQLRSTVTEAALHPIVSGLSEMTSRALYPTIYGATGAGGLAGMFGNLFGGGRLNDVKLVNGAVPVYVTGGGDGGGGTSIFSVGGYQGGGGTFDSFNGGATRGFGAQFRRFITAPDGGALGYDGGGDGGVGSTGAGDFGGFGSGTVGGMRGFNLSPLAGLARNLASSWKQLTSPAMSSTFGETPGGESMARALGPGLLGSLKRFGASPLAKAGAGTAGMMLAQYGLLGNARGTAGGVFEGALGGAALGFSLAPGPAGLLGAGIGAAAGLGVGLGEMLAGVESPRNEAKRLVQSLYHISINNTTADQVVSMANQTYGGRVSVAVRSPEVRRMLGLYAAGTGQGNLFQASSDMPHGASLVESGGRLYQQATYQYGQAYTQSSNLPVYGGVQSQTLGSPGGLNLSLNIGGTDAAKFLQGNVVSPDVVQTQYNTAMTNSNGRVAQALLMSEPGSIAS
jgi:hypothetical protein